MVLTETEKEQLLKEIATLRAELTKELLEKDAWEYNKKKQELLKIIAYLMKRDPMRHVPMGQPDWGD